MYMPNTARKAIYRYLFSEGVICAPADFRLKENPAMKAHKGTTIPIKNLWVLELLKSFVSRGLARKQFAWQTNYFFLTEQGVEFLRAQLGLDATIVPRTWKRAEDERKKVDASGAGKRQV